MDKKLLSLGSTILLDVNNNQTVFKIAQYFEDDDGKVAAYLGISQEDRMTNIRIGINDKFEIIEH